ncbi:MAG: hypothetical protein QNK04_29850 [Myxococcota bacterium]|nr:hypothetical protein [Myxococcota bacterium]
MLEIRIEGGRTGFEPGAMLRGTLAWALGDPPEAVELRLLWYTRGRGDQDVGVARTLRIESTGAQGSSPFELEAPSGPYSCSGRLVSICWALEAVAKPGKNTARTELVIAPGGREVDLTRSAT